MSTQRHLIALLIGALVLLGANTAIAGDWSETDVFVDAAETAELVEQGAALVDARQTDDYHRGHIPGATNLEWQQFVDGDASGKIIDDDRRLTRVLEDAGISSDEPVIVYGDWGDAGWGEDGRIFWMLEYLGHDDVYLLTGGLDAWNRAGHPVAANGTEAPGGGDFDLDRRDERRASTSDVQRKINGSSTSVAVLDTRDRDEYRGTVKYGEQRGGHIPDSHHLWWRELIDADGTLVDRDELRTILDEQGISTDDTVIAYCTGGVRSGFVYAALRAKGFDNVQNYDASMWEWTSHDDTPLE